MPKLNAITEATRIDQAVQVCLLLETTLPNRKKRLTIREACEQVGISYDQYRRWLLKAQDALVLFHERMADIRRVELHNILNAREAILDQLIRDALAPFTDPLTRLAIYNSLVQTSDERIDQVGAGNVEQVDFLQGPKLEPGTSRFAASEIEITIKTKKNPVIDITPKEAGE